MKSFILDRHTDPNNPTMKGTQDDKIPIYDSKADAEADLANIEEGAIVATKDTGASEKVVDVVEDGNMNPVTSNAVYDVVNDVEIVTGTTTEGGGTYTLKKYGKVVTLAVTGMVIGTVGRIISVLTLPVKFRPSQNMQFAGTFGGGSMNSSAMVVYQVSSNGGVTTYPYSSFAADSNQLSATWIID